MNQVVFPATQLPSDARPELEIFFHSPTPPHVAVDLVCPWNNTYHTADALLLENFDLLIEENLPCSNQVQYLNIFTGH